MRTYHIAGAAGVQVTLGLPRLMEILDARRTPTTPAMTIYLEPKYNTRDGAKEIAKKIRETKLRDVVLEDTIDLATFAIEIKIDKGSVAELNLKLDEIEKKARNVLRNFDVSLAGSVIRAVPKKEMSIFELQKAKAKVLDTTILGISGIEQVVVRKTKGEWVIYTSGSNLKKILKIDGVDGTRVLTNDIHEIEAVLGIEAARNSIIKEISSTLEQQGLVVGIRHIMLVADMMTAGGTISPIGRYGLSGEKASVLARANFETTVRNITSAAINGEVDSLGSIIENVLINQVVPVGTGMFDLVLKK
jgi:DNA-directed RNA polymerase subunit A"